MILTLRWAAPSVRPLKNSLSQSVDSNLFAFQKSFGMPLGNVAFRNSIPLIASFMSVALTDEFADEKILPLESVKSIPAVCPSRFVCQYTKYRSCH